VQVKAAVAVRVVVAKAAGAGKVTVADGPAAHREIHLEAEGPTGLVGASKSATESSPSRWFRPRINPKKSRDWTGNGSVAFGCLENAPRPSGGGFAIKPKARVFGGGLWGFQAVLLPLFEFQRLFGMARPSGTAILCIRFAPNPTQNAYHLNRIFHLFSFLEDHQIP
jgi:hypothetical protein